MSDLGLEIRSPIDQNFCSQHRHVAFANLHGDYSDVLQVDSIGRPKDFAEA
jgi:hypothetical protein